jgi:hypothetical protein
MVSAERHFRSFARRPLFHLDSACSSSTTSLPFTAACEGAVVNRKPAAAALQACKLRNFHNLDCTAKRSRYVAVMTLPEAAASAGTYSQELRQRDCATTRRSGGVGEASNASVGAESFGHRPRSPYASQPFGGSLFGSSRQRADDIFVLPVQRHPFLFFWNTVADAGR